MCRSRGILKRMHKQYIYIYICMLHISYDCIHIYIHIHMVYTHGHVLRLLGGSEIKLSHPSRTPSWAPLSLLCSMLFAYALAISRVNHSRG